MANVSAKEQIAQQLRRLDHRVTDKNIFIKCPFPEHRDNTPSFSVYVGRTGSNNIPLGTGYCWGCGRSADWAQVAKLLSLDPTLNGAIFAEGISSTMRESLLPKKLTMKMLMNDMNCEGVFPIDIKVWRGVPRSLLKDMGCFFSDRINQKTLRKRRVLVIPCHVNNVLVGGLVANIKKIENFNSYFNSPGSWVLRKGYVGFDYSHKRFENDMPMIVVEGSRDALFWIRDGYPACAILGSKVFSQDKARILTNTRRPIIPFFDGDVAGIKANNLVCDNLKEVLGINYKTFVKPYPLVKRAMKLLGLERKEVIDMKLDPANLPDAIREDFLKHYNRVWRTMREDIL